MRFARALWFLLGSALLLASCRVPPPGQPGPWTGDVIDCGADVIRRCGPSSLGPVNSCLGSSENTDWRQCMIGLIGPATCGVETVLACVTRRTGSAAAADSQANPNDEVSRRIANRAREWIVERDYRYADDR